MPVGIVTLKNRAVYHVAQLFIDGCGELARQRVKDRDGKRAPR